MSCYVFIIGIILDNYIILKLCVVWGEYGIFFLDVIFVEDCL